MSEFDKDHAAVSVIRGHGEDDGKLEFEGSSDEGRNEHGVAQKGPALGPDFYDFVVDAFHVERF